MKRVTTAKREPALPGGYALEQRRRKQGLTRGQLALVLLALALVLVLVPLILWRVLFVRPNLNHGENPPAVEVGLGSGETQSAETETEPEEVEIDYGPGIRPRSDGVRKSQDFYTVLILGRDTFGGGNTDTMLLGSYDVTNQKAAVMSIPRDTMVNVDWDVKKINSVYNMYGGGEKGVRAVYREVAQLVGFEPDFRVVVEWDAVGKVVDAIGGVWFDNPYPMDYHDPTQKLVIEQEAGYRLLTGDDAMQIIRWRQNDNDSPYGYRRRDGGIGDSGRMELQQSFLKAVIRQVLTLQNLGNVNKIAKVFEECVETDLTFQNMLWFAEKAFVGGLKVDDVEFLTMPWTGVMAWSRSYNQKLSYVVPKAQDLLDIVNNKLSPFEEVFGMSDLDIMSVTKDGMIRSSTGYVEDRQANSAASSAGTKAVRTSASVQSVEDTAGVLLGTRSSGGADSGGGNSGNNGNSAQNSTSGSGGNRQTSGNGGTVRTSGNSGTADGDSVREAASEPEGAPPPARELDPVREPETAVVVEPELAPAPAPAPETEPAPVSESSSAPETEPASAPESAPAPETEPASAPEPAPTPETEPAPAPEPKSEPVVIAPDPDPVSTHTYTEAESPFLPVSDGTETFSAPAAPPEDDAM